MILRPLRSRATYTAWAWLIVGGALLMPYMMAGEVLAGPLRRSGGGQGFLTLDLWIFVLAVPVVAATGLVLPVRAMETAVARALLGVGADVFTAARGRTALWFTLHLGLGGLLSGATLALVPYAALLTVTPFLGDRIAGSDLSDSLSWAGPFAAPAGVAMLLALVYAVAGTGAGLRALGERVLAPTAGERLAAAEADAHRLTEHNRLARELHDSIGHALSIVTVQAAAAGRVVETDPAFARRALAAVENTARVALADLDHVLGVLRSGDPAAAGTAPVVTLDDIPALVAGSGLEVRHVSEGDPSAVPAVVAREAYRIVQEALTNAARHGDGGPVDLRVDIGAERLEVTVANTTAPGRSAERPRRGGRGLTGIGERVAVLGGDLDAGAEDGRWIVRVRLPLR